jgi:hypothetical protein
VIGNGLGSFDAAAVFQVGGIAGDMEGVAAGSLRKASRSGPAPDRHVRVFPGYGIRSQTSPFVEDLEPGGFLPIRVISAELISPTIFSLGICWTSHNGRIRVSPWAIGFAISGHRIAVMPYQCDWFA